MGRRHHLSSPLAAIFLAVALVGAGCGADDAGVTAKRSDSGTGADGTASSDSDGGDATDGTDATDASTGGATSIGEGTPLDPAVFASDLPGVLEHLGFPSPFPLPDSYEPSDVVGVRVDQANVFGEFEVEYEVAITQPASADDDALFAEWLDRIDETFGTGPEVGRGSSSSDTMETVFASTGFPSDDTGSWDVEIVRPIGATTGDVTLRISATYNPDAITPIGLPAGIAPELPDLSSCAARTGDITYRTYTDVMYGPERHEYEVVVELTCPGATVIDATTAWLGGFATSGTEGEVHLGDGYANVFGYVASDGLTYGFETLLDDVATDGDTMVLVRIERAL